MVETGISILAFSKLVRMFSSWLSNKGKPCIRNNNCPNATPVASSLRAFSPK
jgi:hypothetical protein